MKMIVGESGGWLSMLVWLGLFGLIASFHGIILGYSRQIFALGRAGFLPLYFAKVHQKFGTPYRAIIAGGVLGIVCIYSDEWVTFGGQTLTANMITMAVFGAIGMYIISMLSLFTLRKNEPGLARPFPAIGYPLLPGIALVLAVVSMVTMIYYNWSLFLVFAGLMLAGYVYYLTTAKRRTAVDEDVLEAITDHG